MDAKVYSELLRDSFKIIEKYRSLHLQVYNTNILNPDFQEKFISWRGAVDEILSVCDRCLKASDELETSGKNTENMIILANLTVLNSTLENLSDALKYRSNTNTLYFNIADKLIELGS